MTDEQLFELDRLVTYDDESILEEVRRVARLIEGPVTHSAFEPIARVAVTTCIRRFGDWRETLAAAGLEERYSGTKVSNKMRDQRARMMTAEQVSAELRRVAQAIGTTTLTRKDVLEHSELVGERVVLNRFGSWAAAVEAAGLELSPHGRRWTETDYFENLLTVWTHYGRAPKYAEMNLPPSRISKGAYAAKFGSWGRAKAAFVDQVTRDLEGNGAGVPPTPPVPRPTKRQAPEDQRSVPLGLRYKVLRRDRFRCITCGASPATDLDCELHVDHVLAFSRGGKTTESNLRTLCASCNVGKGTSPA